MKYDPRFVYIDYSSPLFDVAAKASNAELGVTATLKSTLSDKTHLVTSNRLHVATLTFFVSYSADVNTNVAPFSLLVKDMVSTASKKIN